MKSVRSLGVCSRRDSPQKKALKRQFLKRKNFHCCDRDPACIQCGTHLRGGRRCFVLPWVHNSSLASAGDVGQAMEGKNELTSCGLESFSSCPEPASLSLQGINVEGSSEGLPSPSQVSLCSRALPGRHTGTSQGLPGSTFSVLLQGDHRLACSFLGVVASPGNAQTALVVESLKPRFGAVGAAVDCPLEQAMDASSAFSCSDPVQSPLKSNIAPLLTINLVGL